MKKIIILTGTELRHDFMRITIAKHSSINMVRAYCEGQEKSLGNQIKKKSDALSKDEHDFMQEHIQKREKSEEIYFRQTVDSEIDSSYVSLLPKGHINDDRVQQEIISADVDMIVCYGCSILKGPVLEHYQGRILNLHLGLSPYYRGSGTNFFSLVNNEPECVGGTFMILDAGIDTGAVLHQVRATVKQGDTPHDIGNRLICDCADIYPSIILNFETIEPRAIDLNSGKLYQRKDFTAKATRQLYSAFEQGLVEDYLQDQQKRQNQFPIIKANFIT